LLAALAARARWKLNEAIRESSNPFTGVEKIGLEVVRAVKGLNTINDSFKSDNVKCRLALRSIVIPFSYDFNSWRDRDKA